MLLKVFLVSASTLILSSFQISCNNTKSCNENSGKKLLIFIGEKIEVKELETSYFGILPYSQFKSKYKILETVCGEYGKDTIEFISFDHYGVPAFTNFKNAMLFLENVKDTFYQVMYTYYDVYKTLNGEWATPYNTRYCSYANDSTMKPHKISFRQEVSYNIKGKPKKQIRQWYPEPYYKINSDWSKATPLWGNYISELFEIEKNGGLRSWGFFGNPDSSGILKVKDVVLEDLGPPLPPVKFTKKDSIRFLSNWQIFFEALKLNDTSYIKAQSLSKVFCSVCEEMYNYSFDNSIETIDSFITSSAKFLSASALWRDMENKNFKVSVSNWSDKDNKNPAFPAHDSFRLFEVSFSSKALIDSVEVRQTHCFQFVKKEGKYIFYGMKSY